MLYLGGPGMTRLTWLPILFLIFALPIPDGLYTKIAYPLQLFAAKDSTAILKLCGVQIAATGSTLDITSRGGHYVPLRVAEACSGVRSLMMYMALSVAWAYLEDRPLWQRVILVLSAAPIAIVTNILRIIITCFMNYIDKPELGSDFMHEFTGLLMLPVAVGLFWLLGRLLNWFLVEVDEEDDGPSEQDESQCEPAATKGAAS